jgi:hypothetical protein
MLEENQWPSIHFYYPRVNSLKKSVTQEHLDLLEVVKESKEAPADTSLLPWQEQFYDKNFFELVELMLHHSADERPKASFVASELVAFSYQAARALRGSQPTRIDIWEETINGTVATDTPPGPSNRLYVSVLLS